MHRRRNKQGDLLLLLSTDGSYDAGDGLLLTATPLP
jgi:hypothetical protein